MEYSNWYDEFFKKFYLEMGFQETADVHIAAMEAAEKNRQFLKESTIEQPTIEQPSVQLSDVETVQIAPDAQYLAI